MKVLVLSLMLSLNFSVFGQDIKMRGANPCLPDIKKFCAAALEDRRVRAKCLVENYKKLTPACVARINERKASMKAGGGPMGMGNMNAQDNSKAPATKAAAPKAAPKAEASKSKVQ